MPFKFICKYALSLCACGCYICLSIWKHACVIYVREYVYPLCVCVCFVYVHVSCVECTSLCRVLYICALHAYVFNYAYIIHVDNCVCAVCVYVWQFSISFQIYS